MDCASYESVLERVISGEIDDNERDGALSDLLQHANACPACEGSRDLLEWLALPEVERDIADDPGEAYWGSFNDRLRGRIASEPPARVVARSNWPRWAGAVAVVVAAMLALWVALAPVDEGPPSRQADAGPDDHTVETALEFPSSLVEIIENDPAALGDYGFGGDGEWSGSYDDENWVFPETEDLDPAARAELLEWLRERMAEGAGVRS